MLEAVVIGNLGADATIKELGNTKYISFDVAHTEKFTDRYGQAVERTTWVSVLKPYRDNERLSQYLTKGTQVYVRGTLSAKAYQSKDEWVAGINIFCTQLQLLGSAKHTAAPQPQQSSAPQPQQATAPQMDKNDDLQF